MCEQLQMKLLNITKLFNLIMSYLQSNFFEIPKHMHLNTKTYFSVLIKCMQVEVNIFSTYSTCINNNVYSG